MKCLHFIKSSIDTTRILVMRITFVYMNGESLISNNIVFM